MATRLEQLLICELRELSARASASRGVMKGDEGPKYAKNVSGHFESIGYDRDFMSSLGLIIHHRSLHLASAN
jgi:hypothetical protein